MIPIKHLLHINNSIREVFIALSNKEKMKEWYTTGVEGVFEKDEIITFEFVNLATFKFKIIFLVENQSIHLECVQSEWDNVGHIIKYDLDDDNIAYIGDDWIDIPVMNRVAVPIAVANASQKVKNIAVHITKSSGGDGAFCEAVEWIIDEQGLKNEVYKNMQKRLLDNE